MSSPKAYIFEKPVFDPFLTHFLTHFLTNFWTKKRGQKWPFLTPFFGPKFLGYSKMFCPKKGGQKMTQKKVIFYPFFWSKNESKIGPFFGQKWEFFSFAPRWAIFYGFLIKKSAHRGAKERNSHFWPKNGPIFDPFSDPFFDKKGTFFWVIFWPHFLDKTFYCILEI